jgi:hypothetical protein
MVDTYTRQSSVANLYWKSPVSVISDYPITNPSWWKLYTTQDAATNDAKLYDTMSNIPLVDEYVRSICLLNGEVFLSRLEDARPKTDSNAAAVKGNHSQLSVGHTYDPWWRDISLHGEKYYQKIRYIETGIHANSTIQVKVGPNHEELLLTWVFVSTINKIPIYLMLYTFAKFAYVNKKKKEKHELCIHPYMCSNAANYDLE